jgi:Fe-S cluster assembly protein SufD
VDPAASFVPVQTRSERPRSYDPSDFPVPTGREPKWKHSPRAALGPLFDADARTAPVTVEADGPIALTEAAAAPGSPRGSVFAPEDRVAALAWAEERPSPLLAIPAGAEPGDPVVVHVHADAAGAPGRVHLVVQAGPASRAARATFRSSAGMLAENVEIIVGDGARLTLVTVQEWEPSAVHVASHQARVDRDGELRHVVASFGGGVVHVDPTVDLAGAGARAELFGVGFASAGQHLESQVFLHHRGAHTSGQVLYKTALQGASARSVWVGDVLIGPDAVGTDTYEANRNLVLTEGARAESVPNLEIETGDIRGAGHASATGRFDDEQLFYLQSRGIPADEARRLVVLGFLVEVVQKIGVPALESELVTRIRRELDERVGG